MRDTSPGTKTTGLASIGDVRLQSQSEAALIDAAEFARLLSVSKPTVWRLLAAHRIPEPIRLTSQCLRWKRNAVLAWIDSGCSDLDEQRLAIASGSSSRESGSRLAVTLGSQSNEQR